MYKKFAKIVSSFVVTNIFPLLMIKHLTIHGEMLSHMKTKTNKNKKSFENNETICLF